jgi:hypothetical protein
VNNAFLLVVRWIQNPSLKIVIMMLVVVIQEEIVNVCVQLLLLIQESVTDMGFISSGEHKNCVVSKTFSIKMTFLGLHKPIKLYMEALSD